MICLNEAEKRLVQYMAKQRIRHDRAVGGVATVYGAEALKNEIDSFGAELAYCKYFNLFPDMDYEHFRFFDAKLPNRMTVDVKQTRYKNGRLLVKHKDREKLPDLYALMVGEFPNYTLIGHIHSGVIICEQRVDRNLIHPAYAVSQSELILDPRKCSMEVMR